MFQDLPPLKSLVAFEAAARYSSFTDAANELSLTQGAISYQVKQLEQHLGIKLFHRKVRQVELSLEGKHLYQTTTQLLQTLKEEIHLIAPKQKKHQKILTISVSTFFATRWLSKQLGEFMKTYPDITIRLQHSVNDPKFMLDDVDMAICWGNGDFPDCHAEKILSMPMTAFCSPKLLKGESGIKTIFDLHDQVFLRDQPSNDYWQEWLDKAGVNNGKLKDCPVIIDPNVRIQSAIDGYGIILGNPMLQDECDRGQLAELFKEIQLDGLGFFVIVKEHAEQSHTLEFFKKWLLNQID